MINRFTVTDFIKIENAFKPDSYYDIGSDYLEVGTHSRMKKGRTDDYPESFFYLRFGYWSSVDIDKLKSVLPEFVEVEEEIADYGEFGEPKFIYILK